MERTIIRLYPRWRLTRKAHRPECIAYCGAGTGMTVQEMSARRAGILVYPATGASATVSGAPGALFLSSHQFFESWSVPAASGCRRDLAAECGHCLLLGNAGHVRSGENRQRLGSLKIAWMLAGASFFA